MIEKRRASAEDLLEDEFMEHRARLLEFASFLDRLQRASGGNEVRGDFRYRALLEMLNVIGSAGGDRVEAILLQLSDPSREVFADRMPPARAKGAWRETP